MSKQYTTSNPLKIGTRGSPLALAQAHETRSRLMKAHHLSEDAFEIVVIKTTGDMVLGRPLSEIGGKGLFTKEIEEALLNGAIDIAVHSMKDMPTVLPDGLEISTLLEREDVRDAFISHKYSSIDELPEGAVVGSSSLRRRAQLAAVRPDLKLVEFRGNVQTRLKKLEDGVAEATFLACAGLTRLGMMNIANPIPVEQMLPAVAQGAIGIENRADDQTVSELLQPINHSETATRLMAERAFLKVLDGSCRTPIGGLAIIEGSTLTLHAEILRPDGSEVIKQVFSGETSDATSIGKTAGQYMKEKAGDGFFE